MTRYLSLAALFGAIMISAAAAHTGLGDISGFVHGFAHPLGGLDHVLAMVAVGIFAAHLGGWALCLVPAAFVAAMLLGAALGAAGFPLPMVETGIALSILGLGAALVRPWRLSFAAAIAMVGFFAVFHGYAHGAEMSFTSPWLGHGIGFMAATALLHVLGIALATLYSRTFVRVAGGGLALAGTAMLVGIV
jgi:urease accessory protein